MSAMLVVAGGFWPEEDLKVSVCPKISSESSQSGWLSPAFGTPAVQCDEATGAVAALYRTRAEIAIAGTRIFCPCRTPSEICHSRAPAVAE